MAMADHDDDLHVHGSGGDEEANGYYHRAAACFDDHDGVDVFLSLSCGSSSSSSSTSSSGEAAAAGSSKPRHRWRRHRRGQHPAFACRTCGRRFATFQALGGHRTSHLRLRRATPAKPKHVVGVGHACATCGLGFSTGQALGGHMRRHRWAAANGGAMGPAADLGLTQIIVHERPTNSAASMQLLDLFV